MSDTIPHVVYHAALMEEGGWGKQIVREQLRLLRDVGLAGEVRCTHVGHDLDSLLEEARRAGVNLVLVRSDPNVAHYETFAMLEVQRLAWEEGRRPILYLHTKGASAPGHAYRQRWRRAMEEYVVRPWRHNLRHIADGAGYDAVGFNWCPHGEQHFSGTCWIARPDWIRQLPEFTLYHGRKGLVRFSCEMWIGAQAHPPCRAYSLGPTCFFPSDDGHDFNGVLPVPVTGTRLNLGCGPFYAGGGWVNIDLAPEVKADHHEDAAALPGFAAGSVDEIYAGHLAEHVEDVAAAFARWHEVLRPGGALTVAVPDGPGALALWLERRDFPHLEHPGPDEGFLGVATGFPSHAAAAAGSPFQRHRRVFDRSLLRTCFQHAGFREVREVDSHPLMYAPCCRLGWQIAMTGTKAEGG